MATDTRNLIDTTSIEFVEDKKNKYIFNNIRKMRFDLLELSGALGDLGTFIPLVAGVTIITGMDIGAILIFAGIFNILTGILFGQPIPVQPMKAIAAVAIADKLLPPEIAAAGLMAGAVVFVLGISGIVTKLEKIIPIAVIRGIQLGVGLKLVIKGFSFFKDIPIIGINSILLSISLLVVVLLFSKFKKFPSALFLFLTGLLVSIIINPSIFSSHIYSVHSFSFTTPNLDQWSRGIVYGAIPQIPLTLLNSVFAVCILSGDLFPGEKISTTRMATSVGLMNLIGCGLGGLPMCHGSGGLAGQYHFGARTGGSVVFLGMAKLLLGLFFGVLAMQIFQDYPLSVLGIMLIFAGIELASPIKDQRTFKNITIIVITAVFIIIFNTAIGFLFGLITFIVFNNLQKYRMIRA